MTIPDALLPSYQDEEKFSYRASPRVSMDSISFDGLHLGQPSFASRIQARISGLSIVTKVVVFATLSVVLLTAVRHVGPPTHDRGQHRAGPAWLSEEDKVVVPLILRNNKF